MVEALVGKWNFESVENVDAYMEALGISDQVKDKIRDTKPVVEISKDGDNWLIKTTAGDKAAEIKFLENKEVETVNLLGQKLKAIFSTEGGKLIEKQKIGDTEVVIERTVEDGIYISKMKAKGVEATFRFTRA